VRGKKSKKSFPSKQKYDGQKKKQKHEFSGICSIDHGIAKMKRDNIVT